MLKTLLASAALAPLLALGAQAQQADDETTPPVVIENELPSATSGEAAAPAAPEVAEEPADTMAPEVAEDPMAPEVADEPATAGADAVAPGLEEGWAPVDLATISADNLIGAEIRTHGQDTIASVEDVLMAPDGKVENVVARFGGVLGFGETRVLLDLDEITVAKDANENVIVLTDLAPDDLKGRPEYAPAEG